jgi:ribosomal protein L28
MEKKKIIKKILSSKFKPLFGNNRSFSNRSTRRLFSSNKQKFSIAGKTYLLSTRAFRSI